MASKNLSMNLIIRRFSSIRRHFSTNAPKSPPTFNELTKTYGTLATALADKAVDAAQANQSQPGMRAAQKRPQRKPRVELPANIWAYAMAQNFKFDQLKSFYQLQRPRRLPGLDATFQAGGVTSDLKDKVLRLVIAPSNENQENLTDVSDWSKSSMMENQLTNQEEGQQSITKKSANGEAFIFREGVVVLWNLDEKERSKILENLKDFEENSFDQQIVKQESEKLTYIFNDQVDESHFKQHEILHLRPPAFIGDEENFLEKYTISDAMSRSVKLAIRESLLTDFVNELNPIVENLRRGRIRVNKKEVLKKTGQLFALRHDINLDSDFLDASPDFYWERDRLEKLYQQASKLFCIEKRIKVINEKLNYCLQLEERLDAHLSTKHSVRLERIIIFLIALEVMFEFAPYIFDYLTSSKPLADVYEAQPLVDVAEAKVANTGSS